MTASATKRVAYNTAIQAIGKIAIIAIGGISIAVLTRYLGAEGYGKFTLLLVYLQVFALVADMGLFTITVREISKAPERTRELVGNTLSLRALLALGTLGAAAAVSFFLPFTPDVRIGIAIAAPAHFFGLMNASLLTVFQSKLRMDKAVIADIVGRLTSFALTLYVATTSLGFYAVVATASVGTMVTFLVTNILVRRYVRARPQFDTKLWKMLIKESLPLGGALIVSQLYFRLDIFMLSFLRSTAEVGIYGVVYKLLDMLLTLPGFFVNSVFPVLVMRLEEGGERVFGTMQKAFDALVLAGLGFAFGGVAIAPDLMRVVGGQEFVAGADALRVSLFSIALTFLVIMLTTLLIARGKQSYTLKVGLIGLVLNGVVNLYTIPRFGITGAAATTLLSEALICGIYLLKCHQELQRKFQLWIVPKSVVAGGLMVAVMWPVRGSLLLALPIGAAVYLLTAYLLRAVSPDILRELRP